MFLIQSRVLLTFKRIMTSMEVTDSNIRKLIPPNVTYSPNQFIIDKLSKFHLMGRNAYYWDNILLSLANDPNIDKNKFVISLFSKLCNKFNLTSLEDVLIQWDKYYIESILQECKNLRPTHITMPLVYKDYEHLNSTIIMNRIANYQKKTTIEIPLDKNQAIKYHTGTCPVIQNETKLELGKLFEIDPSQIWYPLDNEGVSILRCVFHLLLRKYGLDIPFLNRKSALFFNNSKNLSDNDDDHFAQFSFIKFCEYFISQIPKKGKINKEMLNHFNTGIYQDKSPLCHFILQLAQDIYEASTSTYILNSLNTTIIARVKQTLGLKDLPTVTVYCKKINKNLLQQTILCNSSLNANDLLQVLSNYPNLQGDTNVISLGMCPIKSKYIISNFPYYKGKQINVKDGIITILPIKDEELSTYNVSTVPKIFNYLKKSVSFDGNYERFRSIIKSVNIELIELIEIYSIFYNLNGFSCAVIAAEILNHYNNIKTNSENMYILLSKLTPFEIKHLDTALKNSCKLEDSKMDPMDILLRSSLKDVRAISTKRIENAMKELIRIPKFSSKINRISMKNYSFLSVEIIQFYKKQTRLNTKERECIILLLLYSDVSNVLKKLGI